jgi:hypothetical protein
VIGLVGMVRVLVEVIGERLWMWVRVAEPRAPHWMAMAEARGEEKGERRYFERRVNLEL